MPGCSKRPRRSSCGMGMRARSWTIAAAAGRTKGAVYAHFKNKEDLFLALFEQRTGSTSIAC